MTFPPGHRHQRVPRSGERSGHLQHAEAPPRRSAVRGRAALATALGAALAGAAALSGPAAASAHAATKVLTGSQSTPVNGGAYTVQNNEWGSSAPESITADGGAGFTVANSSISNATNGAPGGYPSIYAGCHWGNCTRGGLAANPVRVSTLTDPGTVTTSWSTAQPRGGAYDVAYDIWFNQTPTTSGQPNGTELMIWLNHNGPVQPFGSEVASNVSIGGRSYNVWFGRQAWNTVSYTMTRGATSVSNLDVGAVTADAVARGYIQKSWYLIDVEAGFELWQRGAGLVTKSFSVKVNGRSPSPKPAPMPRLTPAPKPVPSPASAPTISLQAISPDPTTRGIATNITVDFKNTGRAIAPNRTLVIEIRNAAGTVVRSRSWPGQNLAPRQTLNKTCTWRAASSTGTYTIEGLVQNSSGKTLQHRQAATITVT